MLDVNQLTRRYGNFVAVRDVGFNINKGEIVGLLGHNGAGKTTIMKMLSGYLEPDQGQISVAGYNLAETLKQAQQHIGYLPESLPVYPELIVADYLDYAARLKGLTGETKCNALRDAISATDIGDKLLAPIATLSRGYKQRVGVAQAILGRPQLLILDEPTNGLDPNQTEQMRNLIRDLAQEATVLLSTHIMQEVEALCSRVLIVNQGQLVIDESLTALRRSNHLLLTTSASETTLRKLLPQGSELKINAPEADAQDAPSAMKHLSYTVTINEQQSGYQVASQLANALIQGGEQLYRLQPEQRDLETLFHQVSRTSPATEEINDAA